MAEKNVPNLTVRQQMAAIYKQRTIKDNCRAAKRAARESLRAALKQRPAFNWPNFCISIDQYQQYCLIGQEFNISPTEYETIITMLDAIEPGDNLAAVLSAICIVYYLAENLSGNMLLYGQRCTAHEIAERLGKLSVECSTVRYKNITSLATIKRQSEQANINYAAIYVEYEQPLSFIDQDISKYTNTIIWRIPHENCAERSDVLRYIQERYAVIDLFCPSWESASYIVGRKKRAAKKLPYTNYKIVIQSSDATGGTGDNVAQNNFNILMDAISYTAHDALNT